MSSVLASLLGCADPTPPPAAPVVESLDGPVAIEIPAGSGAMTPNLASIDGTMWLLWQERVGTGGRVRVSRLDGAGGGTPSTVVESDRLLVNGADFPSLVGDGAGGLFVHWLVQNPASPYAYDIALAHSPDGVTFRALGAPHHDGTPTEHGFVSLARTAAGTRMFWLDGRATPSGGSTALMTASLSPTEIGTEQVVDERVCDCCGTAAVAAGSELAVFYRDRDAEEVRDVALRRWPSLEANHLGAEAWTITGCPMNGPSIDAEGDRVAAAWFTAAGGVPRVRVALSRDAGRSFSTPVDVDAPGLEGEPLGRVDVALAAENTAVVTWIRGRGEVASILVRRVSSGAVGPIRVLGEVASAATTGFPRVERDRAGFVAAWTASGEGGLRVVRLAEAAVPQISENAAASPRPVAQNRDELPDFVGHDLDGRPVSLRELRGKAVLLNFWATWCGPCREELPELAALARTHADAGLVVLALSVDRPVDSAAVRSSAAALAPGLTVLHPGVEGLAGELGVVALPRSFLYGRDGVRIASFEGKIDLDAESFRARLAQALVPPSSL